MRHKAFVMQAVLIPFKSRSNELSVAQNAMHERLRTVSINE